MRRISFGARTYNASIGRFDGVDPLAGLSRRFSPYNYVYDNPLIFIDPDGRFGDIYNQNGTHIGNDGIQDNRVYVLNTTSEQQLSQNTSEALTTMHDFVGFARSGITDGAGLTELNMTHEEFIRYSATVYNEASGMPNIEKDKVASAMENRKDDPKYSEKSYTALTDKIMFNSDSHNKKMSETDRKPGNTSSYGNHSFTNQDVSASKYREFYNSSIEQRNANSEMKASSEAVINQQTNRQDLVNGANSWRGNGRTHRFFYQKQ
ncbi:hypothetical protein C0V77_10395 [Emticicia sp. TH156]|nr:hypothetical protein C0V77_10395 [Emticicia sp. TH156]